MVIFTKYLGATATKGARVKATSSTGLSVTLPISYSISQVDNHIAVAKALCARHEWRADLAYGQYDSGYVFVMVSDIIKV